ncbi:MAG: LysM domain-containing protein [Caldilineales bacterium]
MRRILLFGILLALLVSLAPVGALAPAAQASAPASAQRCVYHTVRYGQNLSSIAVYYGVNMWTIAQRNGIWNPDHIYAGQTLLIYCYTPKPPPAPKPTPTPKPAPSGACTAATCQGGSYTAPPAQPGDGAAAACSIPPQNGFGNVWMRNAAVRDALGCPSAGEQGFSGAQQTFYSGFAVANDTSKTIYVLYKDGRWQQFNNTWGGGDVVYNPGLTPPAGWCQPEYGIGKVWRNEAGVSQGLGWGRAPASATNGSVQQYQGGLMLWTPGSGVWVLYNNGTYKRF